MHKTTYIWKEFFLPTQSLDIVQSKTSSGSSNYINQQRNDKYHQSTVRPAVESMSYAKLQGIDWCQNEYQQLNK